DLETGRKPLELVSLRGSQTLVDLGVDLIAEGAESPVVGVLVGRRLGCRELGAQVIRDLRVGRIGPDKVAEARERDGYLNRRRVRGHAAVFVLDPGVNHEWPNLARRARRARAEVAVAAGEGVGEALRGVRSRRIVRARQRKREGEARS